MYLLEKQRESSAMNKFWIIILFLVTPFVLLSQNINTNVIKAKLDIQNGNHSIAIDSLDKLIKVNPKAEYYLTKAEAYYRLGELNKAMELCSKADKLKPYVSSDLQLEISLVSLDKKAAIKALDENLKSRYKVRLYDLLNSQEYAAIFSMELDHYILSNNFYSQTEKQIYQVERLIDNHKFDQALFILHEILLVNDHIADAHYLKAKVLFLEKNIQGALNSINMAITIKSTNSDYLILRTRVYNELKNFNGALTDINKIIRLEPYVLKNYIVKTDLLFKNEKLDEAGKLANEILNILPNDPDILYLNGKSNYLNRNYLQALKYVNQSLEIKSKKEYFELRGDIYSTTKTYQYAIQDYSMFLDIEPYNADVYAKKGLARFNLGDQQGACSDWEKAKRYGSYDAIKYIERYCE